MLNIKKRHYILIFIIFASIIFRFYRLEDTPAGFHQDEVSQAYNSFAIATTGHDRYGELLPILFRSFGSYQPAVHTYLAVVPISLLGNTITAARFISALAGIFVVIFSYFIITELFEGKNKYKLALIAAAVTSISPWAIHFSRRVVEANLGLAFFLAALYLFARALKRPQILPWAALVMGISTHAYYSERVIGVLFLPLFIVLFWKSFRKHKWIVFSAFVVFGLTMLPHVWLYATGAFARRFEQVSYFGNDPGSTPRVIYLAREFVSHYLNYLSPRNLFADTGAGLARVSPDLGVFFSWFIIPFALGLNFLIKSADKRFVKFMIALVPVSLIPAALTGDVFYPLRALEFLWAVGLIIALGLFVMHRYIGGFKQNLLIFGLLVFYSLFSFYTSYFLLFAHETTEYVGGSYIKLTEYLDKYEGKNVVIDSARDFAVGLRIAYFKEYPAGKLAEVLRPQLTSNYYSSNVGVLETYKINNIETRLIDWGKDECLENGIIIGDLLSISQDQAKEHSLELAFEVDGPDGLPVIKAYYTHPEIECK